MAAAYGSTQSLIRCAPALGHGESLLVVQKNLTEILFVVAKPDAACLYTITIPKCLTVKGWEAHLLSSSVFVIEVDKDIVIQSNLRKSILFLLILYTAEKKKKTRSTCSLLYGQNTSNLKFINSMKFLYKMLGGGR